MLGISALAGLIIVSEIAVDLHLEERHRLDRQRYCEESCKRDAYLQALEDRLSKISPSVNRSKEVFKLPSLIDDPCDCTNSLPH